MNIYVKKFSPFLDSGSQSATFWYPKVGTFAKSARFQMSKNGTLSVRIQKRRTLFDANIPPKWCQRYLFYPFLTF